MGKDNSKHRASAESENEDTALESRTTKGTGNDGKQRKDKRRRDSVASVSSAEASADERDGAADSRSAAQGTHDEREDCAVDDQGAVDDEKTQKLRKKLAKAVRKGNAEKIEKYMTKLLARGATLASIEGTIAGDESAAEAALIGELAPPSTSTSEQTGHDGRSGKPTGAGSSSSSSSSAPAPSSATAPPSSSSSSSSSSAVKQQQPHDGSPPPGAPADAKPGAEFAGFVLARNGKWYPKPVPQKGNTSLCLFYAYVQPVWTQKERAAAIEYCHRVLSENGITGRLRTSLEGFNATLTGPYQGMRNFCQALREYNPERNHFENIDFKIVDGLPDNKAFKGLKVWPVMELVHYGFDLRKAPLELGGTHVKPDVWSSMAAEPNTVMIDVRNANESAIGWFQPPPGGATLLDPRMRRSTEFPQWVQDHKKELEGKTVMMYCTAGIRCERASAFLATAGVDRSKIFQLEGGIHKYLDAYKEDGGIWVGKNYVFDKRFAHGAETHSVVSHCSVCKQPWDRYQAQAKCSVCLMEVLLCRDCQKAGADKGHNPKRLCWLCEEAQQLRKTGGAANAARLAADAAAAKAFKAAGGGRHDAEGEGQNSKLTDADHDGGGAGGYIPIESAGSGKAAVSRNLYSRCGTDYGDRAGTQDQMAVVRRERSGSKGSADDDQHDAGAAAAAGSVAGDGGVSGVELQAYRHNYDSGYHKGGRGAAGSSSSVAGSAHAGASAGSDNGWAPKFKKHKFGGAK